MKCLIVLSLIFIATKADVAEEKRLAVLKECAGEQDLSKFKLIATLDEIPIENDEIVKVLECVWRKMKVIKDDNTLDINLLKPIALTAVKKKYPDVKDLEKLTDEGAKQCTESLDKSLDSAGIKAAKTRNCFIKFLENRVH